MSNHIGIYDHNLGEQLIREMTADEQAKRDAEISAWLEAKAQKELDAQALRQTKIAAYKKLGLSEEEIEALLPAPKAPIRP